MTQGTFRRVERCRVCGGRDFDRFLDLGTTPLANAFVEPARAAEPELRFPLEVLRCERCGLVQLSVVVSPDLLFRRYLYATSASAPMVEHFTRLADEVVRRFAPPGSLVVEIGSNDGALLRPLRERGANVLGIEPAHNLGALANAEGLETWEEFFSTRVARRIVNDRGNPKVVLANNVLAHVDDLHELVAALDLVLDADAVFIAEVPFVGDLLDRVEYDTIYHEHLSYFAIAPLEALFKSVGLELFDVRRLTTHGGSIRIHVGRRGLHAGTPDLEAARAAERSAGLNAGAPYARFASGVAASRDALHGLIGELRSDHRGLAAVGATAKSCTLLNYCGIGAESIAFVADSTPLKHGLLTPGTHIPVRPESALLEELPEYALMLAWNYADAIMRRHADYIARGGRFIHPIPLARLMP